MLGDPKRLRTTAGTGFLVSWKHRLRTNSEPAASDLVARILSDPSNVAALQASLGSGATMEELAAWLVTGLTSGAFELLTTRVQPPTLDEPPQTDLIDLLPPDEPKRDLESLTFEVMDQQSASVSVRYQVYAPSGNPAGALAGGERRFVGDLEADAGVEVEFSGIMLSPRTEDAPGVEPSTGPDAPMPSPTGGDPSTHAPLPAGPGPRPEPGPNPNSNRTTAWYELRVVDELGQGLASVPLVFVCDGASISATTDASGVARIDANSGRGTVTFEDAAAVVEMLRERWGQAREGDWMDAGEAHTYLAPAATLPTVQLSSEQRHTVVFQPKVTLARIRGMLFDTNRAFLLPSALGHVPRLTALYTDHPEASLLLVGHTDATGEPDFNDPLSLERAESVAAFLRDDPQTWLGWYDSGVPWEKRWGGHEDAMMLASVFERSGETVQGSPLLHFQRTRGLADDGVAGPVTREALISEYMSLDGTTLPDGVSLECYGCGESFPVDGNDAANRRVELFVFDPPLGVIPPRPGDVSPTEDATYAQWRQRAMETIELDAANRVHAIVLDDALFGVSAAVTVEVIYAGGTVESLETDAEGRLAIQPGRGAHADLRYTVRGRTVERRVFTSLDDVATPSGAWQRLHHLGYLRLPAPSRDVEDVEVLEDAMLSFQLDYGLEPSGALDDDTVAMLLRAHDQDLRPWQDRDWDLPETPEDDAERPKEEVS